jgi:hypothetical protein
VDNFDEAAQIWRECVPKSGQSETIEGELLRAVEKLRDEAERNGNGNWDEGFEILVLYLKTNLLDPNLFPQDVIRQTAKILDRLSDFERPCLDDEPYDTLGDRVVDYFRYFGSRPHEKNPALWR